MTPKPKKKKAKKPKFKSLKKGALAFKSTPAKEETSVEEMSMDEYDDTVSSDTPSPCTTPETKRKPVWEDDERVKKKSKNLKSSDLGDVVLYPRFSGKHQAEHKELRLCENGIIDLESKQLSKNRNRGKLSIPFLPLKRVFTIKPEKLKKKVSIWSKDYIPSPGILVATGRCGIMCCHS